MDKITIDQIKQKAIPLLKQAGVTKSSVFGSYARGENTKESDIDILVELPIGTGLFGFLSLKRDFEHVFNKKVDLVTYKAIDPRIKESSGC